MDSRGRNYRAQVADANLAATDVDDTGTYSEIQRPEGLSGLFLVAAAAFGAGPTDDMLVEVYSSLDGTNYEKIAAYDTTITKSAGATVYAQIVVTEARPYFKVLMKSAGATDTPAATLTIGGYRE